MRMLISSLVVFVLVILASSSSYAYIFWLYGLCLYTSFVACHHSNADTIWILFVKSRLYIWFNSHSTKGMSKSFGDFILKAISGVS